MKYSYFQLLFGHHEAFVQPEKTYQRLKQLGYSGLEITPPKGQHDRGISTEAYAKRHSELRNEYEMDIVCVNECWGKDWDPYIPDYKTLTESKGAELAVSETCSTIDFAFEVGAPLVTITAVIGEGITRENAEDAVAMAIDTLQRISKYAKKKNIRVVFEATNHIEVGRFINSVAQHKRLIQLAAVKNAGIQIDTFHANIEEMGLYESIIDATPYLWHMHFRDSNGLLPGYGKIDFKTVLRALRKINYAGYCTIEATGMMQNPDDACRRAINYLRLLEEIVDTQLSTEYPLGFQIG